MDLYGTILAFMHSIMLVPTKRVEWIREDDTVIEMTLKEYLMRSFLEQLLERTSVDKEEFDATLDKLHVEENERPTGECYSVRFLF
jgi:hypothetical protein